MLLPSLLGVMEGEVGQYHGSHINASVLPFLAVARRGRQGRLSLIFFSSFLSPPRPQITPAPLANTSGSALDGRNRTERKTEKRGAATPAAAETSVSLSGRSVPACPPSYLECADETIRCSRRVAACAGGEGGRSGRREGVGTSPRDARRQTLSSVGRRPSEGVSTGRYSRRRHAFTRKDEKKQAVPGLLISAD